MIITTFNKLAIGTKFFVPFPEGQIDVNSLYEKILPDEDCTNYCSPQCTTDNGRLNCLVEDGIAHICNHETVVVFKERYSNHVNT